MNYNYDGPECIDEMATQFYTKHLGNGVFGIDDMKPPKKAPYKVSEDIYYYRDLDNMDGEELEELTGFYDIQDFWCYLLDVARCPRCNYRPEVESHMFYINPNNGAVYWFCKACRDIKVVKTGGYKKVDTTNCWNYLPSMRRKNQALTSERELLFAINEYKGANLKTLAELRRWSYGKAYATLKRLHSKRKVILREKIVDNHKEIIAVPVTCKLKNSVS